MELTFATFVRWQEAMLIGIVHQENFLYLIYQERTLLLAEVATIAIIQHH
ncbi:hypothetical protein [uncultured Bacteroides sp.]|nr:hypothetical protein [uncultured Bacteroides sp.]